MQMRRNNVIQIGKFWVGAHELERLRKLIKQKYNSFCYYKQEENAKYNRKSATRIY